MCLIDTSARDVTDEFIVMYQALLQLSQRGLSAKNIAEIKIAIKIFFFDYTSHRQHK